MDDDIVADVCFYPRDRPLAVDANSRSLKSTIWVGSYPAYVEIVCHSSRGRDLETGQSPRQAYRGSRERAHDEIC